MLILTRKKNESMIVDNQIVVKVLNIKGNRVRLGIEADDSISIRRSELDPIEVERLATVADEDGDDSVMSIDA